MWKRKYNNPSALKLGIMLVVLSYALLIPMFAFIALSIGPRTAMWCKLATGIYILSWILFLAGFLVAGPEAIRTGGRWITRIFTKKTKIEATTDAPSKSDTTSE